MHNPRAITPTQEQAEQSVRSGIDEIDTELAALKRIPERSRTESTRRRIAALELQLGLQLSSLDETMGDNDDAQHRAGLARANRRGR